MGAAPLAPDGEEAAVTSGDARHGRRDNGLSAAHYAAAGDVDPRVGEHLLDVLAVDGIAAYLRPSADINPLTRSSVLPNRPTDRLYVDRTHLATARNYLARLAAEADGDAFLDGSTGTDVRRSAEDIWAEIVAGYDAEPDEVSWPEAEDVGQSGNRRRSARAPTPTEDPPTDADAGSDEVVGYPPGEVSVRDTGPADRASSWVVQPYDPDGPSLLDGLDTFGADLADEDGYTPPAPPPIPRPSLPTTLGVAGIVGGLIFFLKPDLLPIEHSVVMMLGFTAVVAGFATLVWRLRPGDDDDDPDPDDGARV
jgi:hypothetical protein